MIVDLDPGRHCGSVTVRHIETGTGGVTGTRVNARGTEIVPGTVTGSATESATAIVTMIGRLDDMVVEVVEVVEVAEEADGQTETTITSIPLRMEGTER